MRRKNWEEDDLIEYHPEDEDNSPLVVPTKVKLVFAAVFTLVIVLGGLVIFKNQIFPPPTTEIVTKTQQSGKHLFGYKLKQTPSFVLQKGNYVWLAFPKEKTVGQFDITQQRLVKQIKVPEVPHDMVAIKGGIWVAGDTGVLRIDIETGDVGKIVETGNEPSSLLAANEALWAINKGDDTLSKIDTSLAVSQTIPIEPGAFRLATTPNKGKFLWIAHGNITPDVKATPLVSKLDMKKRKVVKEFEVGDDLRDIIVTNSVLWTLQGDDRALGKYSLKTSKQIGKSLIDFEARPVIGKYLSGFLYIATSDKKSLIVSANKDTASKNSEYNLATNQKIKDLSVAENNFWFLYQNKKSLGRWQICTDEAACKYKVSVEN